MKKVSDIFSKNKGTVAEDKPQDAGRVGAFPVEMGEITGASNCKCFKTFVNERTDPSTGAITSDFPHSYAMEMLKHPTRSIKRSQPYHRFVVDKIMGLMDEPDAVKREQNVKVLEGLHEQSGSGDIRSRNIGFINHLVSHAQNSGMSQKETEDKIGLSSGEMQSFRSARGGMAYKTEQEQKANKVRSTPTSPSSFGIEDCATCEHHRQNFNNGILSVKKDQADKLLRSGPISSEYANRAAAGVASDVYKQWRADEEPSLEAGISTHLLHDSLDSWDKHNKSAHGISFKDVDQDIQSKADNKPRKKNRSIGGWSIERTPGVSTTDITPSFERKSYETEEEHGKRLDYLTKKLRAETLSATETREPLVKPKNLLYQPSSMEGVEKATEYPSRQGPIVGPSPSVDTGATMQTGESWNSVRPIEDPGLKRRTIYRTPRFRAEGFEEKDENKVTYYEKERENPNPMVYKPSEDPRSILFENPVHTEEHPEITHPALRSGLAANLPREHKFLFQRERVLPDLSGYEDFNKKLDAYKNQPTHESVDTGRTEEIEEPVTEKKLKLDESGNPVTRKIIPDRGKKRTLVQAPSEYEESVFEEVPKLDRSGKPVTKKTTRRIFEQRPIPQERMLPAPVLSDDAKHNYESSFKDALTKAYPYIDTTTESGRQAAMQTLKSEHAKRIGELEAIRDESMQAKNRRIQAKKDNKMIRSTFNSNTKLASGIGAAIVNHVATHGVDGVKQLANHVVDYAMGKTHSSNAGTCPITVANTPGIPSGVNAQSYVQAQCDNWRQGVINNVTKDQNGSGAAHMPGKVMDFLKGTFLVGNGAAAVAVRNKLKERENSRKSGSRVSANIDSIQDKLSAAKKNVICTDCGAKGCEGDPACRQRVLEKMRGVAADNSFNTIEHNS